jgi:Fic family protein
MENFEPVINYLLSHPGASAREIFDDQLKDSISYSTIQRTLRTLLARKYITVTGNKKSTRYEISPAYQVIREIDADKYFEREIDERNGRRHYNHDLMRDILNKIDIFTPDEVMRLNHLHEVHSRKISGLSKAEYRKSLETFSIDLSWKSSQIEGNTYTLLETIRLLENKETAEGRTKDEAVMLLNHKEAIDFLINEDMSATITLRTIEELHSMLVKELGVDRNIRRRAVSISGTNYRPLDNEFQIREALEEMCGLVNLRKNVFEKAILVLLLISYIQPFVDGNKRTARIIANALLFASNYCPVSFRTVSPSDYKKAMLIFYEQNNISAFKKIFIEQYEFAVDNYF